MSTENDQKHQENQHFQSWRINLASKTKGKSTFPQKIIKKLKGNQNFRAGESISLQKQTGNQYFHRNLSNHTQGKQSFWEPAVKHETKLKGKHL